VAFPNGTAPKYGLAMLEPAYCGKWIVSHPGNNYTLSFAFTRRAFYEVLETLLHEWRRDSANKVLIFTKSVKLLDMLEHHIKSRRKESRELHVIQHPYHDLSQITDL
jgi:hypothetical protein